MQNDISDNPFIATQYRLLVHKMSVTRLQHSDSQAARARDEEPLISHQLHFLICYDCLVYSGSRSVCSGYERPAAQMKCLLFLSYTTDTFPIKDNEKSARSFAGKEFIHGALLMFLLATFKKCRAFILSNSNSSKFSIIIIIIIIKGYGGEGAGIVTQRVKLLLGIA